MMINNLCDTNTNKDEWISGCSYGERSLKWFWRCYYYNYVRFVQNSECMNRYYDNTTNQNHLAFGWHHNILPHKFEVSQFYLLLLFIYFLFFWEDTHYYSITFIFN